jgi:hypothetical protein
LLTVSKEQALVPLGRAEGSELFHAAWIARAAAVTVRRLEDDVEYALGAGSFDPSRLPALPDLAGSAGVGSPAGVQTGAQATRRETDVWSASVPGDVARLFRACLASSRGASTRAQEGRSRRCSTTRSRAGGSRRLASSARS